MLTNRRLILAVLALFVRNFVFTYIDNILVPYLEKEYELTLKTASFFFSILLLTLIPVNMMIQCLSKPHPRRAFLITATFIEGIACLFVGPSKALAFPGADYKRLSFTYMVFG